MWAQQVRGGLQPLDCLCDPATKCQALGDSGAASEVSSVSSPVKEERPLLGLLLLQGPHPRALWWETLTWEQGAPAWPRAPWEVWAHLVAIPGQGLG